MVERREGNVSDSGASSEITKKPRLTGALRVKKTVCYTCDGPGDDRTIVSGDELMPVLPIAKLGNPVLRKIAARVDPRDIRTKEFQQLIDDMFETMLEEPGIGLAAPQVSRSIQLVVMGCEGEGGVPTTTLINPTIVYYGPQQVENWEGCLSVDGFRGKVTRPGVVRVQALDRHGKSIDLEADGLYAVCIQHEMDHLIGKVFLDRMTDLSTLTQLSEFEKFWRKEPTPVI